MKHQGSKFSANWLNSAILGLIFVIAENSVLSNSVEKQNCGGGGGGLRVLKLYFPWHENDFLAVLDSITLQYIFGHFSTINLPSIIYQ